MREMEMKNLLNFFVQVDESGISNAEKAKTRSKVIRRIASTDKTRSFEESQTQLDDQLPGVAIEDGKVIGLGIHIFYEDVYPLQRAAMWV